MTPLSTATLVCAAGMFAALLVGFAAGRWSVVPGERAPRPKRSKPWRYWRP